MRKISIIVKRWLDQHEAAQKVIDGGGTDHEVLGAFCGVPPEAFAIIEDSITTELIAAKINRYWNALAREDRPSFMTMRQFKVLLHEDKVNAWKIGNALRHAGWTSSRRLWKENGPRCRIWMPPDVCTRHATGN